MSGGGLAQGTAAYRRLSLAMLLAGLVTFGLLYAVQALLPLFTQDFGISAGVASLAVSLATGPMAVALLAAAVISDRIGRRPMMAAALLTAASLTIASAILPGWHMLLLMRVLTGVALAGIPAVAMAYIAEEVDGGAIGPAMGLYIAGSAIGGMAGRLGASIVADHAGWRVALGTVGAAGLAAGVLFVRLAPPSRRFSARRHDRHSYAAGLGRIARDAALPWLYAEAFLLMGVFVTIYNYVGFRLIAPPYALGTSTVGAIFLLYIVGSFSATWFGELADRWGRRRVFPFPVLVLLGGIVVTAAAPLWLVIAGVGIVTAGFFGAHSIASSWVGKRTAVDRALATSFYLFSYYLGSSVLGTAGGIAWTAAGWHGVALFGGGLTMLALAIALKLATVPPLAGNIVSPAPEPAEAQRPGDTIWLRSS